LDDGRNNSAIAIDEEDDDPICTDAPPEVLALTCEHAFYYISKPRPDGTEGPNSAAGRRSVC
jgi:hypothetical protein